MQVGSICSMICRDVTSSLAAQPASITPIYIDGELGGFHGVVVVRSVYMQDSNQVHRTTPVSVDMK